MARTCRDARRRTAPSEEPDTEGPRRSLKRARGKEEHVDGAGPSNAAKSLGAEPSKVASPTRSSWLGGSGDAPLLDPKSVDPRDQWMLMLLERIERLEENAVEAKELLVRIILSPVYWDYMSIDYICLNVYAFLLGVSPEECWESNKELHSCLPRADDGTPIVPERAKELFNLQKAKDGELYPEVAAEHPLKPFWELTHTDFTRSGSIKRVLDLGSCIEYVLKAMTMKELEQYWAWHMSF